MTQGPPENADGFSSSFAASTSSRVSSSVPASVPVPASGLPAPPRVELRVVRDRSAEAGATGGFVDLRRVDLVVHDGSRAKSEPFAYDAAVRAGMDAVVVVAFRREGAARLVYLRSAVRAPIALRDGMAPEDWNLWEVPAGIVEPGETPREAAARELVEELGFDVEPGRLVALGAFSWPAPGLIAERHYYFTVDVTDDAVATPREDGSPLERGASIVLRPLGELLAACRRGELPDAKSELGLRRFAEVP